MIYTELNEAERAEAEAFRAEVGKLYDVRQVALILSVSTRTVNNYIKSGRLQGVKIGGKWRFTGAELQRFLSGGAADE
ncbi:MAG: helix-turn-helix domain-containing protein [Akkermansia sp.]|nr:helix-turn-helix domain-containing protein [Akkermansia sp.]MBR2407165.1 helix-turn-helix domain-containing protein [Clostridia bacterium]MBR3796907.1 helix-turn-helix domain-containing protein [Clostridia bacterium]